MEEGVFEEKENTERLIIGKLASGEDVVDQPTSHIHHTVKEFVPQLLERIEANNAPLIIKEFEIEEDFPFYLAEVDSMADDLFLAQRMGRNGYSVFAKDKPIGKTNIATVILRKNETSESEKQSYILATAYAGKTSPREPWDPWFDDGVNDEDCKKRREMKMEAIKFWTTHALIPDENEFPIIKNSHQPFDQKLLEKLI
jgi:hypothetical protein